MRRMGVLFAVAGLALVSACGGGTASNAPAPTGTARVAATAAVTTNPVTPEPAQTDAEATLAAGDSPAAGGTPAAVDLCSLVSATRVSAVLKENVADGLAETNSCTWSPSDATGTTLLIIEQDTVDDFDSIRTVTGGVYEITTVTGLGDDAYVSLATGTNLAVLYVRKADKVIQIAVLDTSWTADDVTAAEKTIASEAVFGL